MTVHLDGRLGNNCFQVAAAAAHAANIGTDWWACVSGVHGATLAVTFPALASHLIGCGVTETAERTTWAEPAFSYRPLPPDPNLHLVGYFQSARYWEGREEMVRALFPFSHAVDVSFGEPRIVAHVRRGDYLAKPDYHPALPAAYYREAFDRAGWGHGAEVLIHTDDPAWCREQFGTSIQIKGPGDATVRQALLDFAMAGTIVIANSSLSWWGAYLGQATKVYAPSPWFGPRGPQDTHDLLPPTWETVRWR